MYRWTIPTWTEIQPFEWQMFIASGMVEFHRFLLWAFINISVLWAEEKSGNISTKGRWNYTYPHPKKYDAIYILIYRPESFYT